MALIGKLINRLLKSGTITIVQPDGTRETYGPGGGKTLTVRVADRRVAFELMRNPRLAVGEAYMDERLVIEDGTILDLLEVVTASSRWEDGGKVTAIETIINPLVSWIWAGGAIYLFGMLVLFWPAAQPRAVRAAAPQRAGAIGETSR